MILTWMGTAALLFEEAGTTIAFDPFPGMPYEVTGRGPVPEALRRQRKADAEAFRRADEVFVTHGHFDHILYIPALYAGRGTTVHCTRAPYETLRGRGFPRRQLVLVDLSAGQSVSADADGTCTDGTVCQAGPFTLRPYRSQHCRFDRKLVAGTALDPHFLAHLTNAARIGLLAREYPEAEETLLWEVACGGKRVQVLGSLNLREGEYYPTGADVLILPYQGKDYHVPDGGGHSPLAEAAAEIIGRLRPKAVLLDHYDDAFPPLSADVPTDEIVRLCGERFGISCRPLIKYETVRV